VKAALEIMGHRKTHYRLPLVRPSAEVETFLRSALINAGLLDAEGTP
ncbi:MAG TPA: 4-hydroxy-tetrahydrodipicolinate synthase, partial [Gemmatimonadetes bacterium]|nr:4-hydroxy-tetrahydrodipicolinate synthase [Gemmatimonadota bacterium]